MGNKILKFCSKCKKEKSVSEFSKGKAWKDKLQVYCKKCMHYYRQTNKYKISRKKYRKTVQGMLITRFHKMEDRCNNPKNPSFKNYGGRGIQNKFKSSIEFVEYVTNTLQIDPRGLTVDRINNNGNYEPGNIRFVSQKINNNNKRNRK